mgnify:CR=1 FL=1
MHDKISRRTLVKTAIAAGAFIPALGLVENAAAAAPAAALDPNDPQAKALGYVADTTKVDAKANPTHKPEQKCDNCAQFQGKAGDAHAGCNIFAGKSVAGNGWCKVWAKKP